MPTVNNTESIKTEIKKVSREALEQIGLTAENDVVKYITQHNIVDTGRLRNSITHQMMPEGNAVQIGTNVEYAPYVELGTSRMKSRPYLRQTITDNADKYRKMFRDAMSS